MYSIWLDLFCLSVFFFIQDDILLQFFCQLILTLKHNLIEQLHQSFYIFHERSFINMHLKEIFFFYKL